MTSKDRTLTKEEQLARGPMDLPFLMLTMMLLGFGLVMVLSASSASSYYESGNAVYYFLRQTIFASGGVAILFVVSRINYQQLRWMSVFALWGAIALLVLVLVPGVGVTRNNATRWLSLGFTLFQPSEAAKLGVILYFSRASPKCGTKWGNSGTSFLSQGFSF
jgi:cell division protein FtsW